MSGTGDGAGQGIHIYQQTPAAAQEPCCDPARHGSSPRTWRRRPEAKQGQTSPKYYVGSQAPRKRWAHRPFGVLGWQSSGCLGPRPWLFGADTLGVLGSPPWLFEHLLATNGGTGNKAPERPPPQDPSRRRMGAAHDPRRVSVASGQPAPYRWEAQGQGTSGHKRSTGARQGSATSG